MNERGIFHNDIHESNIMISEEDYKIYLIDFSRVTFNDEGPDLEDEDGFNEYWPDLPQVIILLEQCIWYTCENPILYDYFRTNGIVPDSNFNPDDELKESIELFIKDNKDYGFNKQSIIDNFSKYNP